MYSYKRSRPTIGVLPGWEVYERAILQNYLGPILYGTCAATRDRDCNLLLACGFGLPGGQIGGIHPAWPVASPGTDFVPVGPWNTDGLIVVHPLVSEDRERYIQDLAAGGHPIVHIGTVRQGRPVVVVDNEGGIRQAMAHLVGHGHRRIAFIAGNPADVYGDTEERLQAYRAAIQAHGLEADPALVAYGYHIIEGGQLAMKRLLDSGVSFTAVLASNDEAAIGVMLTLKEAGLRVPQDVAVIGFDDLPEAMAQTPPLTTVHSLTFERGYRAVELLLEYVEGRRDSQDLAVIKVPTRLIVRRSCSCLPADTSPAIFNEIAPQVAVDLASEISRLAQMMGEAMLAGTRVLGSDEVCALCERLVTASFLSLEQGDPADFQLALREILQRVETVTDDVHEWQRALSVLREEMLALMEIRRWPMSRQQVEEMLDRARIFVSESVHRQYMQHIIDQKTAADQMFLLTDQLLMALDEQQILEILGEHLPNVGIQHAVVAFSEAEDDDPVAWSLLHPVPECQEGSACVRSREFPPEGLYPPDQPFSLALLPLVGLAVAYQFVIEPRRMICRLPLMGVGGAPGSVAFDKMVGREVQGFVAFDTGNLELCGAITQQLLAALKMAGLYREATEGRRLAEEGQRLAEEASRMKSRFLSMVSHELRTPLSLIVGLSEMVLHEEMSGLNRQDIAQIHANAQHLDGLIQDVLDLTQSDMGQLKLVCQPLNLTEELGVVAMVGEQLAHDKRLSWRVEIPDGLPKVWGDRTRLRQVALNLISNAIKFTSHGEVMLRAEASNGMVTISVSDTGLGIPVEEQEVIFDEFRQSERTAARGYGGLGLGLSICKRLVEMHNGEIGVRSSGEEGAGSTFYFTLPAMKSPVARPEPASPLMLGQRVLLLAERSDGGERLREHLTRQGFVVDALWIDETADWASQLLMTPPGAAVLDLGLASERGWETLKVLKSNSATQDIPVLFYTLAQDQDSGALLELDYLTKPVGSAELMQALRRQGLADGKEKTVLLVDDEPGILEMHARIVRAQSESYRVLKAQDGREALTLIRGQRPDLVLLDLMMPQLDGFGVLEAMREDETTRGIPVIVLTGQVLTEEDMVRLNRGVVTVLSKGMFSVEETLMHIEEALAGNKKLGSETQRLVRRAMAYIHERYTEPISRDDIACHVGVSKDYLTRCFSQEMGVSLVAYLNRYRVNQAKVLLAEGSKTVTKVAAEVGFADSNYFSRIFRREVGTSPSDYARAQR